MKFHVHGPIRNYHDKTRAGLEAAKQLMNKGPSSAMQLNVKDEVIKVMTSSLVVTLQDKPKPQTLISALQGRDV